MIDTLEDMDLYDKNQILSDLLVQLKTIKNRKTAGTHLIVLHCDTQKIKFEVKQLLLEWLYDG